MDLGLHNRVVLVTGSSAGIGRATAIAFGREGARVGITYHHQREHAEETATRVAEAGGQALVVPYDLGSEDSIAAAIQAVVKYWGSIHVLVNNAVQWGSVEDVTQPLLFEEVPFSRWKSMLDDNLTGVYLTMRRVVPFMRAQQWGRMVTLSSDPAFPGAGAYAAAKAGLHGLTRVLAHELGPLGILTNVVIPGFTLTERNLQIMPEQQRDLVAQQTPTGRLSTPEDVAPTIVFLGSAANTQITGVLIHTSGGVIGTTGL
jgi:NAD(P)-dependent dehydrogenase (short-subunit alcohol dehydrogenase family)